MENIISLSFCIPTYNNVKSLKRLVLSILENQSTDIEVVVLDNGSTDHTLSILDEIKDKRLNVYSNDINKGALFNMVNVLEKGRGKYLVYCTDHDHVDNSKIDDFRNFLITDNALAFGYCEYDSKNEYPFKKFKSGYEALLNLAYMTRHPTGFFFKNEFWKSTDSVNRFANYEFVDLFPLEFVFAELSLLGDGAIYYDPIFSPERGARVKSHKSATTNGKSKTAFFAPQTRLKLAVNFAVHLQTLDISSKEKKQLIINSFLRELHAATFNFRKIMMNEALCEHYYMEKRTIGKIELSKIALEFYNGYKDKVIKATTNTFLRQTEFKFLLGFTVLKKMLKKISN